MYINSDVKTRHYRTIIKKVELEQYGHYKELPKLGIIKEPMIINDWRIVDRKDDDTPIPHDVDRHVLALKKAGAPIVQELIGHNLKDEEEKQRRIERNKQRLETAVQMAKGLMVIAGVVVSGVASLIMSVISFALAVDPVLIVVLEDGTWLCVAEWDD